MSELDKVFTFTAEGNTLVVAAKADLGSLQADIDGGLEQMLQVLTQSGAKNVVLDFANAQYFGTAMLGAMVKLWKRICTHQGRMALCNVSERVLEVLRYTKLHTIWPIYPNREEALRAIGE